MAAHPNAPRYLGLRFGFGYGPGRVRGWRELQGLIERVAAGERELTYPDYPEAIDWTWVDDAAATLKRALERPLPRFKVVNVAGDKRRVREAIKHLQRRFPICEPIRSLRRRLRRRGIWSTTGCQPCWVGFRPPCWTGNRPLLAALRENPEALAR